MLRIKTNNLSIIHIKPEDIEFLEDMEEQMVKAGSAIRTKVHTKSGKTFATNDSVKELQLLILGLESNPD